MEIKIHEAPMKPAAPNYGHEDSPKFLSHKHFVCLFSADLIM